MTLISELVLWPMDMLCLTICSLQGLIATKVELELKKIEGYIINMTMKSSVNPYYFIHRLCYCYDMNINSVALGMYVVR